MSDETIERVIPGTLSWKQYGAEHIQRYDFFKSHYKGKSILDAACGTGYGSHFIAQNGAKSVLGIDISDEAIDFAKNNYVVPELNYIKEDCLNVKQLNKKFDLIISFETVEHLSDPELFFQNIVSVLNPNGTFICSTPNKDRLSGSGNINPFHYNELAWMDFKKLFEKYFVAGQSYQQSESVEYMRYQELKHLLHQSSAQSKAFLFNRFESLFRKSISKNFKSIPYFRDDLDYLYPQDIYIEPLENAEKWHKTYIITGTLKA